MNLAGVEIILNMREKMEAMQRQIEGFVSTLNQELSERTMSQPFEDSRNSLMPVIQISSMVARMEAKRPVEIERKGR